MTATTDNPILQVAKTKDEFRLCLTLAGIIMISEPDTTEESLMKNLSMMLDEYRSLPEVAA